MIVGGWPTLVSQTVKLEAMLEGKRVALGILYTGIS